MRAAPWWGESGTPNDTTDAFLYTDAAGMRDLNDLIPAGSGWFLQRATGINDRGQIVGFGRHNGQTAVFG